MVLAESYDNEEVDEQYEEWEVVRIILEKLQSQYHHNHRVDGSLQVACGSKNMSQFVHIMGIDEDGNEIDSKGNSRAWLGLIHTFRFRRVVAAFPCHGERY